MSSRMNSWKMRSFPAAFDSRMDHCWAYWRPLCLQWFCVGLKQSYITAVKIHLQSIDSAFSTEVMLVDAANAAAAAAESSESCS